MELLFDCAACIAPFLNLPSALSLIQVSKKSYEAFTQPQVWVSMFNTNNIEWDKSRGSRTRGISPELKVSGLWKFNSWESNNRLFALDHSGYKNHIVFENRALDYTEGIRNGIKIEQGSQYFATASKLDTLNATQNFTVEILFQPNYTSRYQHLNDHYFPMVSKHGTAAGWEFRCAPDCVSFIITPYPYHQHVRVIAGIKKKNDKWYHVAATFDGKQLELYIDGKVESTATVKFDYEKMSDYNRVPLTIGRSPEWHDRCDFTGIIKEVRVCNSTLTPDKFFCKFDST